MIPRNKRNGLPPLDTSRGAHRPVAEGGSAVIKEEEMSAHIEKLKQVSLGTQRLSNLLVDQIQVLTETVPVLHGFEIVKGLRKRSKECHEGIQDGFKQLATHIEHEKSRFYTRNAEAIKKLIHERVEQGVERRLPIALRERLARYKEYLKTNSVLTDKVKQAMAITSARDANSILSPSYDGEEVTMILPHTDWNGLTLGNLKNIAGPAIAKLARDQGLTPLEGPPSDSERVRIQNLNMILKHLGVHYQAVPSWNGTLLTSATRKTNH